MTQRRSQEEYATKIEALQDASDDAVKELENERDERIMEQTYLGSVGKIIEPIFAPIGFDWC